jgi:hypothetical protein
MVGVHDFLKFENVSIWVTPVGRAEEADGLGLRVKRNSGLLEPLVFGKNVDHVEGDVRYSRVARGAIDDRIFPYRRYISKDLEVRVACAKQGGFRG